MKKLLNEVFYLSIKTRINLVKLIFLKKEIDLKEQIEYAEKQLEKYQLDPNLSGTREALDFEKLEKKIEDLTDELRESNDKLYHEKAEKEKVLIGENCWLFLIKF